MPTSKSLQAKRSNRVRGSAISQFVLFRKQRKTATEERGASLFFRLLNHRRPRVSAETENLIANNLLEKQQKQPELQSGFRYHPLALHFMNASEQ
jgi:hypothetical protein